MSKPTQELIMFPGPQGWEVWSGMQTKGYEREAVAEVMDARLVEGMPAGDVFFCFPVKQITAVPMMVNSPDESLFADLALLHAERLGLKVDPFAGQLTDTFIVHQGEENSVLLSVFLRTLSENELPLRSPKGFDLSARALAFDGSGVAIWRELGSWVFAFYQNSQLLYCQSLGVGFEVLDGAVVREMKLAMMQFKLQGIGVVVERVQVWTDEEVDVSMLKSGLNVPVTIEARPNPRLPQVISKLLPEDVRAARKEAKKRLQVRFAMACLIAMYLGTAGWLGYGLWKVQQETKVVMKEVNGSQAERESYEEHLARWKELEPAIDLRHSPVDILYRVSQCIPAASGLRLKTADISATDVKLIGVAPDLKAVNMFSLKLTKANDLSTFVWQTPEPNQTAQGWEFVFSGELPKVEQP